MPRTVLCNTMASYVLHWTASQVKVDLQIKDGTCGQQGARKTLNSLTSPLKYELLLHDINTFHPFYGFVCQKLNIFREAGDTHILYVSKKMNVFILNYMYVSQCMGSSFWWKFRLISTKCTDQFYATLQIVFCSNRRAQPFCCCVGRGQRQNEASCYTGALRSHSNKLK